MLAMQISTDTSMPMTTSGSPAATHVMKTAMRRGASTDRMIDGSDHFFIDMSFPNQLAQWLPPAAAAEYLDQGGFGGTESERRGRIG